MGSPEGRQASYCGPPLRTAYPRGSGMVNRSIVATAGAFTLLVVDVGLAQEATDASLRDAEATGDSARVEELLYQPEQ